MYNNNNDASWHPENPSQNLNGPDFDTHQKNPGKPQLDPNRLVLPVAILIAAVLVSGTLVWLNYQKPGSGQAEAPDTVANLKDWGKEVGLNSKQFNKCLDDKKYSEVIQSDLAAGNQLGIQGTPGFFVNSAVIEGAQPFTEFQRVIEAEFKKAPQNDSIAARNAVGGTLLGNPNATVTILEFSDLQCPFCRSFWRDTLPQLKQQYLDTCKVNLVYRHWPLNFHPAAIPGALATECAKEQGKFWEMHDKIYSEQEKIGQGTVQF